MLDDASFCFTVGFGVRYNLEVYTILWVELQRRAFGLSLVRCHVNAHRSLVVQMNWLQVRFTSKNFQMALWRSPGLGTTGRILSTLPEYLYRCLFQPTTFSTTTSRHWYAGRQARYHFDFRWPQGQFTTCTQQSPTLTQPITTPQPPKHQLQQPPPFPRGHVRPTGGCQRFRTTNTFGRIHTFPLQQRLQHGRPWSFFRRVSLAAGPRV